MTEDVCETVKREKDRLLALRRLWRVILLAVIAVPGRRSHAVAPPSIFEMAHKAWTTQNGAPANIKYITRGPDGLLWMTTDAGLFRFDGVSFDKFIPSSGNSLLSDHLWALSKGDDGSIWVSYAFGGVSRITAGTVTNYTQQEGLGSGQIRGIGVSPGGVIWLSGTDGLYSVVNARVRKVGPESGLPPGGIHCFAQDDAKNLWLSVGRTEVLLPAGQTRFRIVGSIPGTFADSCWVGTNSVSLRADTGKHLILRFVGGKIIRTKPRLPSDVTQINEGPDGSTWLTTSDRGILYVPQGRNQGGELSLKTAQRFDSKSGLSSDTPIGLSNDDEGSVWIFTEGGLDQFRANTFRCAMSEIAGGLSIAGRDNSPIYIGSNTLSVVSNGVMTQLTSPVGERGFRSLYIEPGGTVWGGTERSLFRFQRGILTSVPLPHDVTGNIRGIQTITGDSQHGLWISVVRHGLFRLLHDQWLRNGGYRELPDQPAVSSGFDATGNVWFGYLDGRVATISAAGQLRMFSLQAGPHIGTVKVFTTWGNGLLLGGESGISSLIGNQFCTINLQNGRPLSGITGLVVDGTGDLWASGSTGIVRIPHAELERAAKQPGYLAAYEAFDSHDGLKDVTSPMAGLGSARQGADGNLYFITLSRLNWLDPRAIRRNSLMPQVTIDQIRIDEQTLRWPVAPFRMKPNPQNIQVLYKAGSLLVPDRVRFRYRLEGYDTDWIEAGGRREAFYSKLPPGSYTFQVIAANDAGIWNKVGASITFAVPPTFTQTALFKLLVVLTVAGIAMLLFRIRLEAARRTVARQMYGVLSERQRIARDLHDTFLQSVQAMTFKFAVATRTLPEDSAMRAMFDQVVEQSDQVLTEGRGLITDLRTEEQSVSGLFDMLKDVAFHLQSVSPTTVFVAEVNTGQQCLPADFSREVIAFAKEALTNAFHHANAAHIWLKLDADHEQLFLQVRDDGSGIDPEILTKGHRPGHWGLQNMKERAERLGGRITIRSTPGNGTAVELAVPAYMAFPVAARSLRSRLLSFTHRRPQRG